MAVPSGTNLLWDVVSRRGRDPRHEVAGDEGADDHGAPAGRLLLQRVPVKVQGGQDDGHLADLPGVAWNTRGSGFTVWPLGGNIQLRRLQSPDCSSATLRQLNPVDKKSYYRGFV